jgi:LacI family transcriptional regulator
VNKPVTLRDVAVAAKVHPSTVSRALHGDSEGLVSRATVARIRALADKMGYEPNALAQGLKINRTQTIGMVIPDLTNSIFPPMARGIEDELGRHGYTLLIANTDNDEDKERKILGVMARRRVDGLIIATARRDYPLLEQSPSAGSPVVLVNRTAEEQPYSSVVGDDHEGVRLALRHLVGLGHTRIAHLAGTRAVTTGLQRYRSYLNTMESLGLTADPDLVVFCDWFTEEHGAKACNELLDRRIDFTAVLAANDRIAMGAYDVATARGLQIPDDFSMVGYNDSPFAERLTPALTSVRVKAAELIVKAVGDPDSEPVSIALRPRLMVRASTAAPGAGDPDRKRLLDPSHGDDTATTTRPVTGRIQ